MREVITWAYVHAAVRALINLTFLGYICWYYFDGMDRMKTSSCGSASARVVFFAPVDLFGWYRTLGKVVTVVAIVETQVMIGVNWEAIRGRRKKKQVERGGSQEATSGDRAQASTINKETGSFRVWKC
ncbi:hypothetical protein QBC36DRAFT_333551 [Triangularia setosa]|uniref:Uncharacterized protein n=1 Tax=Triangularia setosa TaxID=2587417 RepID=A0AAN7A576_9PEZI|nr:hypothetical protein QBC36DRAFT_333551 [Podospora setosa]